MRHLPKALKVLPAAGEYMLQAIFPEPCLHCGGRLPEHGVLCAACEANMPPAGQNCAVAGAYYQTNYVFLYEGVQKSLFKAAKFAGRRRAQTRICSAAGRALAKLAIPGVMFLPMPSSRSFLNAVLRSALARGQLQPGLFRLRRQGTGDSNKRLGEAARFRRIRESLVRSAEPLPRAELYVLCDDVLTTGATLGQAAWLLEEAGIARDKILLWALFYRARQNAALS